MASRATSDAGATVRTFSFTATSPLEPIAPTWLEKAEPPPDHNLKAADASFSLGYGAGSDRSTIPRLRAPVRSVQSRTGSGHLINGACSEVASRSSVRPNMPEEEPAEGRSRMVYRCAILDDYQNVALKMADWSPIAKDVEVTVFNEHLGGQDKVIKALADFDIICGMRERTAFSRAVIGALPKLKLLITTGARNASFDLKASSDRNVIVCGTPSVGNPTAGIAIGLMLELTRRVGYENARMKAGEAWHATIGVDLGGLTLRVIGLGKLGQRVARIAKAFGMDVIAWSQNLTAERCREAGVEYANKEDLLQRADILTIHVVLS